MEDLQRISHPHFIRHCQGKCFSTAENNTQRKTFHSKLLLVINLKLLNWIFISTVLEWRKYCAKEKTKSICLTRNIHIYRRED